jgi:tRNA threonylcarbamoyladenosine biosynthesis protein TsaE
VLVVEWPERGQGFLPPPDIDIRFFHSGKLREVAFLPKSDSGKKICELLSPLINQYSS